MSIITQYLNITTTGNLCDWVNLSRSRYYYKPSNKPKGIAPSTTTGKKDGTFVSNTEVVDDIKKILSPEFVLYGYQNVTASLKELDYIINHK